MPPFAGVIPLIEGVDIIEPESPDETVDDTAFITICISFSYIIKISCKKVQEFLIFTVFSHF